MARRRLSMWHLSLGLLVALGFACAKEGDMESNWIGITGLVVGIAGVAYGVIADVARRNQRDWVYAALFRLIPLIEKIGSRFWTPSTT